MAKFAQLNCLATLAALIILAVAIAAVTVDWYSYLQQFSILTTTNTAVGAGSSAVVFNSTQINWNMQGVTTMISPTSGTSTNTFVLYNSSTSVWSTFKLMQAFVLIALITSGILAFFLILCFASAIRNQLLFTLGMNVLRVVLLATAVFILASLVIAFLGFLGITNAFSNDTPQCQQGYCNRFADSEKSTVGTGSIVTSSGTITGTITNQTSFGPIQGWFLTLGCIPVAIILTVLVVVNKFPIPVDSVTIGEAL
jgi:hypothetical protein